MQSIWMEQCWLFRLRLRSWQPCWLVCYPQFHRPARICWALQDSSRSIGGSASKAVLRKTLLAAEIALTVTLLISAGLLFKSFLNLRTSDMGCITDKVLTMKYGLPESKYDTGEKINAFH